MLETVAEIIDAIFEVFRGLSMQIIAFMIQSVQSDLKMAPTLDSFFIIFGSYAHKILNFSLDTAWLIFMVGAALTVASIIFVGVNPDLRQGVITTGFRVILTAGLIFCITRPTVINGSPTDKGILGIFLSTGSEVYKQIEKNFGTNMKDATTWDYAGKTYGGEVYNEKPGALGDLFGSGLNEEEMKAHEDAAKKAGWTKTAWEVLQGTYVATGTAVGVMGNIPAAIIGISSGLALQGNVEQARADYEAAESYVKEDMFNKLIDLILLFVATINLIKLMIELYRRYVNVIGLYIMAPPMAALMVGQSTSAVAFKYIQMFGAEIAMLCFTRLWISTCYFMLIVVPNNVGAWLFFIAWEIFGLKIDMLMGKLGLATGSTGGALLDSIAATGFVGARAVKGAISAPGRFGRKVAGISSGLVGGGLRTAGLMTGKDTLLSAGLSIGGMRNSASDVSAFRHAHPILNNSLSDGSQGLDKFQMKDAKNFFGEGNRNGLDNFNELMSKATPEQQHEILSANMGQLGDLMDGTTKLSQERASQLWDNMSDDQRRAFAEGHTDKMGEYFNDSSDIAQANFAKMWDATSDEARQNFLNNQVDASGAAMESFADIRGSEPDAIGGVNYDTINRDGSISGSIVNGNGEIIGESTATRNDDGSYSYDHQIYQTSNYGEGSAFIPVTEDQAKRSEAGYLQVGEGQMGVNYGNTFKGCETMKDAEGRNIVGYAENLGNGTYQMYDANKNPISVVTNGEQYEVGSMARNSTSEKIAKETFEKAFERQGFKNVSAEKFNRDTQTMTIKYDKVGADGKKIGSFATDIKTVANMMNVPKNQVSRFDGVVGDVILGKERKISEPKAKNEDNSGKNNHGGNSKKESN